LVLAALEHDMAESVVLLSKPRADRGSHRARRLRREGLIPAVLYGHKEATLAVALPADDLYRVIRQGARVVDLTHDGMTETALIKDVQWDHLGHDILHVDFARVSADERIQIEVRVELRGNAPGVNAGGVLDQPIHNLEVECLALKVPDSIRVSIAELQIEGAIHVRDLVLPEGVKCLMDPDAIIVHVTAPAAEPEPTAVPTAEQAEPELITRQKPAEEAEES
jgi:large subunit ribosomal protein L25